MATIEDVYSLLAENGAIVKFTNDSLFWFINIPIPLYVPANISFKLSVASSSK